MKLREKRAFGGCRKSNRNVRGVDGQTNGETIDLKIKPVEYETGEYRLGIWVRDNVQGLGTVTFLTDQSRFGALGHGIHDVDTSVLMSIAEGNVYRTSIRDITKGQSGSPGSMEGMIIYNNYNILGTIDKIQRLGFMGKSTKLMNFSQNRRQSGLQKRRNYNRTCYNPMFCR